MGELECGRRNREGGMRKSEWGGRNAEVGRWSDKAESIVHGAEYR